MTQKISLFILFSMSCWCSVTHAEMYKCLDNNGKAKYQANKCPITAKASTIKPADKVEVPVQDNRAEADKITANFDKQIKETTEFYDEQIEDLKQHHLATETIEQEKRAALKALLEKQVKAQEKNFNTLKNEEKMRKDKAAAAQKKLQESRQKQQQIEEARKRFLMEYQAKNPAIESTPENPD